jgi:hypothetical protein
MRQVFRKLGGVNMFLKKIKICLFLLVFSLFLTKIVFSQEEENPKKFSLKIGFFQPSDNLVKSLKDKWLVFGGDVVVRQSPNSEILVGLEYKKMDVSTPWNALSLTIIPLNCTYKIKTEGKKPYFGGGIGYYSGEMTYSEAGWSVSDSKNEIGFFILGGMGFSKNAFAELKYDKIKFGDLECGGLTLYLRMKF